MEVETLIRISIFKGFLASIYLCGNCISKKIFMSPGLLEYTEKRRLYVCNSWISNKLTGTSLTICNDVSEY